ncbi:ABC-type Fe3+-siderophore transport system, permease component [Pleurocapsa sp. PCC 7327]|uniref:FecCD family ABC transporter permease n=1 Tax=Pleurocapsa sp. PCC 7327 TaxID=118163 RepID=UPI00029FD531|nr:iron ABC transporter permease [Pleurocapsa sp. PCC 7327]AFY76628.1 ABC-type Fe3+-siderophore transport system, permease component [Pleurocapsa sp. PCC 7327]
MKVSNPLKLPSSQKQQTTGFSYRIGITILLVSAALILTFAISLSLGAVHLSLSQLWQALWHQGDSVNQTILWQLRLPRVVAAIAVGAALGTSGALLQGMLRNPLAEPFLLGISAGAGLIVITMVTLGISQAWIPFAAWLGAILTTAIVYFLARTDNGIAVERLILGGVAISSLFGAVQTTLLILSEEGRIQTALNWIVGSLNGRGWPEVSMAGPYILIALICACLLGRYLNVLNLGDELAVGLGINLGRSRLLIGATATLLAASAVSMAGLIGFIGLIVPHAMRLLMGGNDYRWLIPLSAAGGALVLSIADLLARLGAVELPVGVVTSLLGSPLFVWFLYRRSFE